MSAWLMADENETVRTVLDRMLTPRNPVGAVAVTREGELVSMVSEQDLTLDFARRMIVYGEDRRNDAIKHYASKEVFWAPESASLLEILELMMQRKIRHVPIAREGEEGLEIVKIVSMRRLLPQILSRMDPSGEGSQRGD